MDNPINSVVFATTTLYKKPDEVRAKLAVEMIRQALANGFRVVAVDASTVSVKKILRESGALVFDQEQPGMGPSRRQAIQTAADVAGNDGVVVWTEEKPQIVPFIEKLAKPIIEKQADLVIPQRMSMDSYPEMQKYAELLGNQGFYLLTGRPLDMWVGVRVLRADLACHFTEYKGEYGDRWDSIFIPVLRMIKEGKRVIGIKVNYIHPKEQTAAEDDFLMYKKRIAQLTTLVDAMEKEAVKLGLYIPN